MRIRKIWLNFSLFNLCVLALLGMILRSKTLFAMPYIDYNHLTDAHGHFAFGGWLTLSLLCLFQYELLPAEPGGKAIYQWLLGGIVFTSWALVFSFAFEGNGMASNIFSSFFIITTFIYGGIFIKDIRKAAVRKPVRLLAVCSICCLILSAAGPIMLAVLFSIKSLNAILYRDALFAYLHLQYNGFFTLAVFALLFHKLLPKVTDTSKKNISGFSILLVLSVIPSLFLSFLWHDLHSAFRIIAILGSILVFLSFIWFIITAFSIRQACDAFSPVVKYLGILSMCAFALKEFLQGFTIFPTIGDAVFGSRPAIIGFLHLVFLGMVSLFILAWYAQKGILDIRSNLTKSALVIFSLGVISNEVVLMLQGLGSIFIISYSIFPWLLWGISIWMFSGALLIAMARMQVKQGA